MSPYLMPDEEIEYYGMPLPLHVWKRSKLVLNAAVYPGTIDVKETDEHGCGILGCRASPTRNLRFIFKAPFGSTGLDILVCLACVHHIILPFWWKQIATRRVYGNMKKNYLSVEETIDLLPIDLVIDGVHQHPYVMEGI